MRVLVYAGNAVPAYGQLTLVDKFSTHASNGSFVFEALGSLETENGKTGVPIVGGNVGAPACRPPAPSRGGTGRVALLIERLPTRRQR